MKGFIISDSLRAVAGFAVNILVFFKVSANIYGVSESD